ncbi:hypothetical protein Tco_0587880 [Tanacetum coccineum]
MCPSKIKILGLRVNDKANFPRVVMPQNFLSMFLKSVDVMGLCAAFRTAIKTLIGCTPYKLVYGKSCHLPIELEHKAYWALKHANFDLKTAGDHQKLLDILRNLKNSFGSGLSPSPKVFPYRTIELSQPDGPNFKVNGHRVKHYFRGDLPPKEVQDLHTLPKDKLI